MMTKKSRKSAPEVIGQQENHVILKDLNVHIEVQAHATSQRIELHKASCSELAKRTNVEVPILEAASVEVPILEATSSKATSGSQIPAEVVPIHLSMVPIHPILQH